MTDCPRIAFEGRTYYQVGCTQCRMANRFSIYFDGVGAFVMKCQCGHETKLEPSKATREPEPKPIDMRFF